MPTFESSPPRFWPDKSATQSVRVIVNLPFLAEEHVHVVCCQEIGIRMRPGCDPDLPQAHMYWSGTMLHNFPDQVSPRQVMLPNLQNVTVHQWPALKPTKVSMREGGPTAQEERDINSAGNTQVSPEPVFFDLAERQRSIFLDPCRLPHRKCLAIQAGLKSRPCYGYDTVL